MAAPACAALGACHVAVGRRGAGAARRRAPRCPTARSCRSTRVSLLEVGPLRRGCRTYVAVAGGFVGPAAFGSSASDELSGLGAGPAGRRRAAPRRTVGAAARATTWRPAPPAPSGDGDGPVALRVVPGPHAELLRARRARPAGRDRVPGRARQQPGRRPPARRGRRRPARLRTAAGDARLAGRGHRGRAGAARRGPGRPPAGPRHPRWLSRRGRSSPRPTTASSASARPAPASGSCRSDLGEARRAAGPAARARAGAVVGHYPLAAG